MIAAEVVALFMDAYRDWQGYGSRTPTGLPLPPYQLLAVRRELRAIELHAAAPPSPPWLSPIHPAGPAMEFEMDDVTAAAGRGETFAWTTAGGLFDPALLTGALPTIHAPSAIPALALCWSATVVELDAWARAETRYADYEPERAAAKRRARAMDYLGWSAQIQTLISHLGDDWAEPYQSRTKKKMIGARTW